MRSCRRVTNPLVRSTKVSTKDIRTSTHDTICDVCGRTLLRGEHADPYLDGVTRRTVCELCKDRALHEGWIREGTVTRYGDGQSSAEGRRSFLARLRTGRREGGPAPAAGPSLRDELDGQAWSQEGEDGQAGPAELRFGASRSHRAAQPSRGHRGQGGRSRPPATNAVPVPAEFREPRHIRAVPTSVEQKIVAAAGFFNDSEHPRTVAGVARSLGAPGVCVAPSASSPSGVSIVVSWELCWYRYEVDLSDELPSVRAAGQGYELSELTPEELLVNAAADEHGRLLLAS